MTCVAAVGSDSSFDYYDKIKEICTRVAQDKGVHLHKQKITVVNNGTPLFRMHITERPQNLRLSTPGKLGFHIHQVQVRVESVTLSAPRQYMARSMAF